MRGHRLCMGCSVGRPSGVSLFYGPVTGGPTDSNAHVPLLRLITELLVNNNVQPAAVSPGASTEL